MLTAREGLIALMLFLTGPAVAADLETLKADCDGCHGPNGVSANPAVPIIAGQKPEFIAKMLRGFQMWDPSVYYFNTIPNQVDWFSAVLTMAGAILFSVLGAAIPAARAADTDPVRALRYE